MKRSYFGSGLRRLAAAVLVIILVAATAVSGGVFKTMATGSYQYSVNTEADLGLVKLQDNTYAVQFAACADMSAVELYVAKTSSNSATALTARLYGWRGSYSGSLRQEPVAEKRFEGFDMDCWLRLDFGAPVPAGEYIFVVGESAGNVQLLLEKANHPYARTYLNASERDGNLEIRVEFKNEGGTLAAVSDNNVKFVTSPGTWVATDGLGREVPNSYTSTVRENKTVGIFFHTWHSSNAAAGTRNITQILAEHPEIQNDFSSKLWGQSGNYHWNEPVWGYYRSSDEWVLRKQAELLADAGVDAVFFDNTNGTATFIDDVLVLLKVWSQARADGVKTPQISFMLPMFDYDLVAIQLREIYKRIYQDGLYKDLWFYWKGKPLMVGWPGRLDLRDETDKAIFEFFNWRVINHAQSQDHVQVQAEDGTPVIMGAIQKEIADNYILWNWIATTPQLVNKNPDGTPEEVAVAIAHNWCAETHLTAMNNPKYKVFGRHYMPSKGDYDPRPDAKLYGAYFTEQWEYALKIDPEFVWVTGWNEGVAGRFEDFLGVENAFPDNFSDEFSRDIEPSKGDLQDHYYYLLCQFVRRFKGVPAAPVSDTPVTVDVATGKGWEDVETVYESYPGDTFDRNSRGYKNAETGDYFVYTDNSGRNDIRAAKASYDADYVYFMAETSEDLTPCTDPQWMRLFISVRFDGDKKVEGESWENFRYVVNRESPAASGTSGTAGTSGVSGVSGKTGIERSKGGWNWEKCGECDFGVNGNVLTVRVPREALGLGKNSGFTLDFKWADNNLADGSDVLELYTRGDTAPEGRFMYRFVAGSVPKALTKEGCSSALEPSGAAACLSAALLAGGSLALAKKPIHNAGNATNGKARKKAGNGGK